MFAIYNTKQKQNKEKNLQQHKAERVYESQNNYVTMSEDPKFHLCIPREEFRSPLKPTDQQQATQTKKHTIIF